jgi:hypothetical protein
MHPNLLASAARSPVAHAAVLKLTKELAEYGLYHLVDRAMDQVAYRIAKKIVQNERNTQEES